MDPLNLHCCYADALRATLNGDTGCTEVTLRVAAQARVAGACTALAEPYDSLVNQIGEAAYRVTDAQVDALRAVCGSDRAAFEIIMAASIAARLTRWDAAIAAIEGANDAPP